MEFAKIEKKSLNLEPINLEEAIFLYNNSLAVDLINLGSKIRYIHHPEKKVSWQIDRNINYTNICISGCKFCNFHCKYSAKSQGYIISIEDIKPKIDELYSLGGKQLLLQGGLHPKLGLDYYETLFRELKKYKPDLKLNALGPPEVAHIARIEKLSYSEVLSRLITAGLDSLPGAGAEILSDRVKKILSPAKPSAKEWLEVMHEAHKIGLSTTATMVYGHIETLEERLEHIFTIRDLQYRKPDGSIGFRSFIAWPMITKGTELSKMGYELSKISPVEHLKMIAIARIILNNIEHIQASWLTMGLSIAQMATYAGADDLGSIMIEENVVAAAGNKNKTNANELQNAIKEAGFTPWLRDQQFEKILY